MFLSVKRKSANKKSRYEAKETNLRVCFLFIVVFLEN